MVLGAFVRLPFFPRLVGSEPEEEEEEGRKVECGRKSIIFISQAFASLSHPHLALNSSLPSFTLLPIPIPVTYNTTDFFYVPAWSPVGSDIRSPASSNIQVEFFTTASAQMRVGDPIFPPRPSNSHCAVHSSLRQLFSSSFLRAIAIVRRLSVVVVVVFILSHFHHFTLLPPFGLLALQLQKVSSSLGRRPSAAAAAEQALSFNSSPQPLQSFLPPT
jgi:hypothetical protein